MPYQVNEARRHKFSQARYRVKNWREYDQALPQRGSLTVWVTPEALAAWHPLPTGQRGRARLYSDLAIETGPLLRLAFGRPWRQTEGLLRSIATLLGVSLEVPDHTTFSRRSFSLPLSTECKQAARPGSRGDRFHGPESLRGRGVAEGKARRTWSPDLAQASLGRESR